MYFVEYQRALRALRIAGVIFGVIFFMAVVGRIAARDHGTGVMLGNIANSPTAHVTHENLPDGSVRTVMDDPVRKIHAVEIVRGGRVHVEITEPAHGRGSTHEHEDIGNYTLRQTRKGGMDYTVIDAERYPQIPIGVLFATSVIMGFIIASMLGGVLAKENDGHLELAWTKPVSRERYAIAAFAVDVLAIVASQILWVVTALVCMLLFFVPSLRFEPDAGIHITISLLAALAWYAALNGWSASLKRGPGIVIGLGWLFATLVPGITELLSRSTAPVIWAIHKVLLGLTYIDPLAYISLHFGPSISQSTAGALHVNMVTSCIALTALAVFYLAVAVAQWRRVEA